MNKNKKLVKSDLLEYVLFRTRAKSHGINCGFVPEKFIEVLCELLSQSPLFAAEHDPELEPFKAFVIENKLSLPSVRCHFAELSVEDCCSDEEAKRYLDERMKEAEADSRSRGEKDIGLAGFIEAVLDNPTMEMQRVFAANFFKHEIPDCDECDFVDEDHYCCEDDCCDEEYEEDYEDYDDVEESSCMRFPEPDDSWPMTLDEALRNIDLVRRREVVALADKADRMRKKLSDCILGQSAAIKSFADGYFRSSLNELISAFSSDGVKPPVPMTFLFAGATGVGKTMLANAAAKALGIGPLLINMSEGFDPNELTCYAKRSPHGIVIFDEIEKAGRSVLNSFLPMLDPGIYCGVDCRGLMMIFTTNACSELYENESIRDLSALPKSVLTDALINSGANGENRIAVFPPEFCSRLTEGNIVMFRALDAETLLKIAENDFNEKMTELSCQISCGITIGDEVYKAMLFGAGCHANARTVKGISGDLFAKSTYCLIRAKNAQDLSVPCEINVKVDIPDRPEIAELFSLDKAAAMKKLMCSSKELAFEIKCSIEEGEASAVIELTDLNIRTAVRAGDMDKIIDPASIPDVRFDDVIGGDDAKDELRQAVAFLKDPYNSPLEPEAFSGLLLHGPAGTGKTMLAKALAGEAGVSFIATEGNRFLKRYIGDSPKSVHDLFATARKYAPCVLFIDEVDAIAKKRIGSEFTRTIEEVLTALLSEMNGFRSYPDKPVYVIAATNFDPRDLDEAFIRRFDRTICVDLPIRYERMEFLKRFTADKPDFNLSSEMLNNISERSTNMSLAILGKICNSALRMAHRNGCLPVDDKTFDEAFESFVNGSEKTWDNSLKERTAYHEAGHAALSLLTGGSPSYITIVARDKFGGYVQEKENEGKKLLTRDELSDRICVCLAGRAAECVRFGEYDGITTGAASDIDIATKYARDMVCRYGMSDEIGLASISPKEIQGELAVKVRTAVNHILSEQLARAEKTLADNRKLLDRLAAELMKKDRISGTDAKRLFRRLISRYSR